MSNFTFYKAFVLLEAAPPGGDMGGMPPGGPPGGDMGGGMPPMGGPPGGGMGGPPGGDPMGGGAPPGQPIEVKSIAAADVWKLLEKIIKDEKKYSKFFEEINIAKKDKPTTYSKQPEKKSSLLR